MSIRPYNNLTVRDLSNVQQSYVNSITEFGYFSGGNLGTIANGLWRSLPAVLNTNNGIARVDASGGLILNPGIYKINLSLFPITTQVGRSNISFNFGTTYLSNIATTNIVNAFGGVQPTGMFTYDPFYNPYTPGIISWVAEGYDSSNNTISNFIKNPNTDELSYNYFNAGYPNGTLYGSNCTTKMSFVLDSSASIYFNVSTNSTTGVTMGNSCFTLSLISNPPIPIPGNTLNWNQTNASSQTWNGIASSSNGLYLVAVNSETYASGGGIYTSSNYGNSWVKRAAANGLRSENPYMIGVASSSSGQYLAATSSSPDGFIFTSSNYGANWTQTNSGDRTWRTIASSSSGQYLAAVVRGGAIYTSSDYGVIWTERGTSNGLPASADWSGMTLSGTGQYLAACIDNGSETNSGIWTSSDYGVNWIRVNTTITSWISITSSNDGKYLAATVFNGEIYTSSNYGVNWTTLGQANGLPSQATQWRSITSSSDGSRLAAVATSGIWTSINYGDNWIKRGTTNGIPTEANWYGIASSSDGIRLAAVINGGTGTSSGIYRGAYS